MRKEMERGSSGAFILWMRHGMLLFNVCGGKLSGPFVSGRLVSPSAQYISYLGDCENVISVFLSLNMTAASHPNTFSTTSGSSFGSIQHLGGFRGHGGCPAGIVSHRFLQIKKRDPLWRRMCDPKPIESTYDLLPSDPFSYSGDISITHMYEPLDHWWLDLLSKHLDKNSPYHLSSEQDAGLLHLFKVSWTKNNQIVYTI